MRIILLIATLLAPAVALAQQAPQAPQPMPPRPAPPAAPPAAAPPAAPQPPSNTEIADLLRAQTAAIKSLSGKLDTLDARVKALENGTR